MKKIIITQVIKTEVEVDEDLNISETEYMADLLRRSFSDEIAEKNELEDWNLRTEQKVVDLDVKVV